MPRKKEKRREEGREGGERREKMKERKRPLDSEGHIARLQLRLQLLWEEVSRRKEMGRLFHACSSSNYPLRTPRPQGRKGIGLWVPTPQSLVV